MTTLIGSGRNHLRDEVVRVTNSLPDGARQPRVVKADGDSDAICASPSPTSRRNAEDLTKLVTDLAESRLLATPVWPTCRFGDRGLCSG